MDLYCHTPAPHAHPAGGIQQGRADERTEVMASLCVRWTGRRLASQARISCQAAVESHRHRFSSDASTEPEVPSSFAAVDHSEAYYKSMQGFHGKQLSLARLVGVGRDDPPFDPFIDEEVEEARALEAAEEAEDETYEGVEEAKIVGEDNDENKKGDDDDKKDDDEEEDDDEEDDDDDDEEDDDDGNGLSPYNNDGSVRRKRSVLTALQAGFPAGGKFAIIELAGSQFKVTTDDLLVVNRLKPLDLYKVGSVHHLSSDKVLLVGSSHKTLVGMPHVPGAIVTVMVEEITRDAKVIVFKKRRRKNSQRRNGFRRDVTMLRILDIRMPEGHDEHEHVGREIVDQIEETEEERKKRLEVKYGPLIASLQSLEKIASQIDSGDGGGKQ